MLMATTSTGSGTREMTLWVMYRVCEGDCGPHIRNGDVFVLYPADGLPTDEVHEDGSFVNCIDSDDPVAFFMADMNGWREADFDRCFRNSRPANRQE